MLRAIVEAGTDLSMPPGIQGVGWNRHFHAPGHPKVGSPHLGERLGRRRLFDER